ncbi:DNA-directed RNA polymerase III subunit [Mycena venus]|uniref:DNA-directed RNA polymerase III subunit n=1 Tax=Mycena venus TaxID=2733690 RepID=A0A8H6YLI3_9AGAR|nr:DNA-directed RNA polymerase III subunit [Mycena venus]
MGGRGRGWGRGRGAFSAPPAGLTHADIQNMSREATAMYPPMIPPILTEFTEDEKKIAAYQIGFAQRMRKSQYYVVEATKSTDLPRYSDKYRPSIASQPTLKKKDLYAPYFPPDIFEGYFNPKKKRKLEAKPVPTKKRMNIDEMGDEDEEKETPSDASDAGSQAPESDYDVDEEYDNDYAENYFDNGENDDNDDLGGGGGGGADEGGGGDYD